MERPHRPSGGLAGQTFRDLPVEELEPLGAARRFVSHRQAPVVPRHGLDGEDAVGLLLAREDAGVGGDLDAAQRLRPGRPDLAHLPGEFPRDPVDLPHHRDLPADLPRGRRHTDDCRPADRPGRRGKRRGDAVPFRVAGEVVRKGEEGFGRTVVRIGVIRLPAEEEADADPRVGPRNDSLDPAIFHEYREGPGFLEKQLPVLPAAG